MSRIWNPLAFDIFGNPNPIVAPPQLRVQGGTLTEVQALSAQNVFAKFCNSARLSSVPNPTKYGQLPDGSQYKIVDVAGNRTMLVWASEGDGGSEEGGGMICLPPLRNTRFCSEISRMSAWRVTTHIGSYPLGSARPNGWLARSQRNASEARWSA